MSTQVKKDSWFYSYDSYGDKVYKFPRIFGTVALVLVILFTVLGSFTVIPTGYTGVRTTFGQISPQTVPNGFNWKIPYVQSIEKVNNKQQDIKFEGQVWSETSERTAIYYENITVTYSINKDKSAWIYANVDNYKDSLITGGLVSSAIKSVSKGLSDVDATNRGIVEGRVAQDLQNSLDEKYQNNVVTIYKVIISNVDFDESYNNAIAAKQQAQINAQQAAVENQRAIEKAEADKKVAIANAEAEAQAAKTKAAADAEVKVIKAKADADALRVQAEAEAEANKKIADSITSELLQKMYYDKWSGKLPTVMGESSNLIMTIPNEATE